MPVRREVWRGESRSFQDAAKMRSKEVARLIGDIKCPACSKHVPDPYSLQQHTRDKHQAEMPSALLVEFAKARIHALMNAQQTKAPEEKWEDALVRIVNSASHDEAIRIATEALLGDV